MVSGFMCAPTDAEAMDKASGWTFFVFCLSHYGKHGIPAPGRGDMWAAYQEWRKTEQAQQTLRSGLIGSPETIRRRLREFEATGVDQVILLNQAGRTTHADICRSLELFARDVMPEFLAS
jgi:alkanesulfonate monooxygenase SsuD/methylene tetrahydromethanopterin reductase-like flavin-dependent oxidoreductase (luciferase family)